MSLNSYALNKAVLNGAGNAQYVQSLTVTSSSTFTIVKGVAAIRSVVSTSAATKIALINKFISATVTATNSLVRKALKNLTQTSSSTSTYKTGVGKTVASTAVVSTSSVVKFVAKIVVATSTTTNTIVKAVGKFVSVVSTNSIVLVKQANKLVSAISNSAVATTKTINKTVSKTISSTATLLYGFLFVRSLSVVTTTTSTISNIKSLFRTVTTDVVSSVAAILKARNLTLLFSASANPYISTRTARFVLLVTTVYTSTVSYIYRVLANVADTLFVPTKKTLVTVVGFVSVLVRPKKTNVVASKQDDLYG